jgi:copper chaperone CopZ
MAETMSERREHKLTRPFLVVSILVLFVACNISVAAGATRILKLRVKGMTCEGCALSIEKALKEADGVVDARVSYERGEARIKFDDQKITVVRLREIIKSLGYKLGRPKVTRGSWVRKSKAMPFSGLSAGCIIQAASSIKRKVTRSKDIWDRIRPLQTSAKFGPGSTATRARCGSCCCSRPPDLLAFGGPPKS